MTDTIVVRFAVPEIISNEKLPFKKRTDIEESGEVKEHSVKSHAYSPFRFPRGSASHCITPCFENNSGIGFVAAYKVSVSVPAEVCGLNALLQNRVYYASLFALYFLRYWLVENGVNLKDAKKFSLKECEIRELHLTYLIDSGSMQEANKRIADINDRANTLFYGQAMKYNKSKSAVEFYQSFKSSLCVNITKSSKFEIVAYAKSFVTPKAFCGLSSSDSQEIFEISKNYIRFEVKLKTAWFSERVEGDKKSRKTRKSKWASPLYWKDEPGNLMYEKVFEQACNLLRLDEKLNQRLHKPNFLNSLKEEHRAIIEAHYSGVEFKNLPFKSADSKQRSKVKRIIHESYGIDLHIAWVEQRKLPRLDWLKYPGVFKLDSVPENLRGYVFAGSTIRKKLEEMKEKLASLACRIERRNF